MIRTLHRIRLLPRATGALVLFAALLLGSLAHGWHHFSDHDCESPQPHHADACAVCASLHAAPMPEFGSAAAAPTAAEHRVFAPPAEAAPRARALALAPARAPPIA